MAKEKYDNYIKKLQSKSEKKLRKMLNSVDKEISKIKAKKLKVKNKLKQTIQKEHFIKDTLMEKWRTPKKELLEAIEEMKNGETETYENFEAYQKAMSAI